VIRTATAHMLGRLIVEQAVQSESEAAGSPSRTCYRPVGVILQNDGRWHYWISPGETYRIGFDGTGWRVTCRTWSGGHVYRMARPDGTLIDRLTLSDRVVELDPGRAYEVRGAGEAWEILEVSPES